MEPAKILMAPAPLRLLQNWLAPRLRVPAPVPAPQPCLRVA